MSHLPQLKSRLRSRIHAMEDLLAEMTTPVQNPAQELLYTEYIRRINNMTLEANTNSLDIEAKYKNDIDTTKLDNLRASITNIELKTSATHVGLCTWRVSNARAPVKDSSPQNQTPGDVRPVPTGGIKICLHAHQIELRPPKPGGHTSWELPHRRGPRDHRGNEDGGALEEAGSIDLQRVLHLRALVNTYDITCDDINMSALEDKLSNLRDMIPTKIQII